MVDEIARETTSPAVLDGIEGNIRALFIAFGCLPAAEVEDSPEMLRFLSGIPFPLFIFNGITGAHLASDVTDAMIATALAPFRERHLPMLWWIGPATAPADLGARLEAHGLTRVGEMPGMAIDLRTFDNQPPMISGLTIMSVRDVATLRRYIDVLVAGYPLPAIAGEGFTDLCARLGLHDTLPIRHYLALLDGEPVATSMLALASGVAGVWNVATLPARRRRGIGTAITGAALLDARAAGYDVGVLLSSKQGFGAYERMGFRQHCTVAQYLYQP